MSLKGDIHYEIKIVIFFPFFLGGGIKKLGIFVVFALFLNRNSFFSYPSMMSFLDLKCMEFVGILLGIQIFRSGKSNDAFHFSKNTRDVRERNLEMCI